MEKYYLKKATNLSVSQTIIKAKELLKEEGMGVLSEINVSKAFKEKLDIDYPEYVILGACHPPTAKEALEVEPDLGIMLPCNIVVYERDQKTIISVMNPPIALLVVNNNALTEKANLLKEKFDRILSKI